MKRIFLCLTILTAMTNVFSQQGDGGVGNYFPAAGWKDVPLISYPTPDIEALRLEDEILDQTGDHPWRFGFNNPTQINSLNQGTWLTTKNGDQLWLLRIKCPGALTVNLAFDHTNIPNGNELYVYNPDKSFILGKFTQEHLFEGQLGTELVPGDEVIIEYFVPANHDKGLIQLNTVTHGYRTARIVTGKSIW